MDADWAQFPASRQATPAVHCLLRRHRQGSVIMAAVFLISFLLLYLCLRDACAVAVKCLCAWVTMIFLKHEFSI
jgi:hypothetical protein